MVSATPPPAVISRRDAAIEGRKFFFTGRPCKHGHLARRYVSIGMCVECSRDYAEKSHLAIRGIRTQKAIGKPWFIVECPDPALETTARAMLAALGCTVKDPTKPAPRQHPGPDWQPPPELQRLPQYATIAEPKLLDETSRMDLPDTDPRQIASDRSDEEVEMPAMLPRTWHP